MRKIYFCIAALCLHTILPAQENNSIKPEKKHARLNGFRMGFGGGYNHLDPSAFGTLQTSLPAKGYALPGTDMSAGVFSMNMFARNIFFGIDFDGLSKRNMARGAARTTDSMNFSRFALGYALVSKDHFLFYPAIAFAPGRVSLHAHQMVNDTIHDVSASNRFRAVDFSLNFELLSMLLHSNRVLTENPDRKLFSCSLGLSIGYMMSIFPTYWDDNNIDIFYKSSNNVNFETNVVGVNNRAGISLFYARLKFSFGCLWKSEHVVN